MRKEWSSRYSSFTNAFVKALKNGCRFKGCSNISEDAVFLDYVLLLCIPGGELSRTKLDAINGRPMSDSTKASSLSICSGKLVGTGLESRVAQIKSKDVVGLLAQLSHAALKKDLKCRREKRALASLRADRLSLRTGFR